MPGTLPLRQYDLVICDIDGCLVSEGQERFDLESLARIAAHNTLALDRGDRPTVTLCSGRPQPFAEGICRLINNLTMPCVCENGVWVYHPGENLYQIDPAITPAHRQAVSDLARWCRETFGPKGVEQQPGKTASVTLWHKDTAYLKSIAPLVEQECKTRGWPFRVSMTWLYINCDLAHVSKASGLQRMLKTLGIPKARIAGIGDTTGDQPIAEHAAFFACPANAQPAIKEHAHYVSPFAEAKGVVDILERLRGE
jgi:hydroxymethylpyrimidine pyrophosphatase-like HAD family hydrolase